MGRIATEHLVSLGHRHIVHLCGKGTSVGRLREEGYRHALEAHGLKAENAWVVPGNLQIEDSRQAVGLLLRLDTRPTAIFGASDYSAFGALAACRELGLQVPRDVSVIGAGDIEGSSNPYAFLATVKWERETLGREAARLLLDMIADPIGTRPATIDSFPRPWWSGNLETSRWTPVDAVLSRRPAPCSSGWQSWSPSGHMRDRSRRCPRRRI